MGARRPVRDHLRREEMFIPGTDRRQELRGMFLNQKKICTFVCGPTSRSRKGKETSITTQDELIYLARGWAGQFGRIGFGA